MKRLRSAAFDFDLTDMDIRVHGTLTIDLSDRPEEGRDWGCYAAEDIDPHITTDDLGECYADFFHDAVGAGLVSPARLDWVGDD